jgi:ABC-type polysaccharide/polyol phosphate transport system ATPase subunit
MGIIEVSGVSKAFRLPSVRRSTLREHVLDFFRPRAWTTLQVLDRVSFDVKSGETLGIMGRNGSGKSTLLKIVAGIFPPDAGRVAAHAPVTPILELGVGWNPELDAIDNIYLLGTVMGLSVKAIRGLIDEILQFAELERFAKLQVQHYSSGMAARLAFSVAFAAVRDILLLDEIFAVGDAGFKQRCEDRLHGLQKAGHTVVIVSHDPEVIARFCNRALLLDGGRVVVDGRPDEVSGQYIETLTERTPSVA